MPKRTLTADQVARLESRHGEERARIRTAAGTLVDTAETKPTIDDLRAEAGLPERWILTTRHIDLKDAFLSEVENKWGRDSENVNAQERKYADLQSKYENLLARNAELESIVNTYAAVIEELRLQTRKPRPKGLRSVPD